MRVFKRICSLLVGSVLFLAGIFKLMDPVGAGLQMAEYFKFFHLDFLLGISNFVAWLAAFFEASLGAAVITEVWKKTVRWVCLGALSFFTILTFVLWIKNPEMECGCFGEVLHLSHSQSLIKNAVLLVLTVAAYFLPGAEAGFRKIKYVAFALSALSVLVFSIVCQYTLPPEDHTPFAPGAELRMEGEPQLSFYDRDGIYSDSLALEGGVVVVSVYDPDKQDRRDREETESFLDKVELAGLRPLLLASGDPELMPEEAYIADHRTLMSFNRSNGGATYINDGQIVRKWSSLNLPDTCDLMALAETDPTETIIETDSSGRMKLQGFLLYAFAVMLLL